jgi:hypothetical protein
MYYNYIVMIRWNPAKSEGLKKERGVSFQEMIEKGHYLLTLEHTSRGHQRMMLFDWEGYVWAVPYVVNGEELFLKTMFPSRHYTKRWKRGEFDEKIQTDKGREGA